MICNCFITKWEGILGPPRVLDATNGTNYLLNGNRINGLEIRATTKSKFMFSERADDPKEKAGYVEAVETVGTIIGEIDKTWQSLLAVFYFYTENDTSKAVFARWINVESIAWITPDPLSAYRCWVKYFEAGKPMLLLCDYTIKEAQAILDTGALTTTGG